MVSYKSSDSIMKMTLFYCVVSPNGNHWQRNEIQYQVIEKKDQKKE